MRVAIVWIVLLLAPLASGQAPALQPPPLEVGWLTVRSSPEGLELRVNGEPIGWTPLERWEASPGEVLVEVSGPCHQDTRQRVVVQAGQEQVVALVPEERRGILLVSAADPAGRELQAVVAVDGLKIGQTPGGFEVSVCATQVLVSHPDQGARWLDIQLHEGMTLVVDTVLDGTFPGRPAPKGEDEKPADRTWLLGLRASALFDTGNALRSGQVKEESKLFDTSPGFRADLELDYRLFENFFLGAWFGLSYAQVIFEDHPDPDLVQADLGAHLGAVVELIPSLELGMRVGLGVSFLLEEIAKPRMAWRFDPGYSSVGVKLAVGVSWFLLDTFGLTAEVGLDVLVWGVEDSYSSLALDYGPLVYLGVGVVYAL